MNNLGRNESISNNENCFFFKSGVIKLCLLLVREHSIQKAIKSGVSAINKKGWSLETQGLKSRLLFICSRLSGCIIIHHNKTI